MESEILHHHAVRTLARSPAVPFLSSPSIFSLAAIILLPTVILTAANTLFPALLTLFRQKKLLFIRLPVLHRPRSQDANGPVMNDANLCGEMLAVRAASERLVRAPHEFVGVAHLVQRCAERGRDGVLADLGPFLQQDGLGAQLDVAASRLVKLRHPVRSARSG